MLNVAAPDQGQSNMKACRTLSENFLNNCCRTPKHNLAMTSPATWLPSAIARIEADYHRSADTHLIPCPCPPTPPPASTCT